MLLASFVASFHIERCQKRQSGRGQGLLSPNHAHSADHGASIFLHGGRSR